MPPPFGRLAMLCPKGVSLRPTIYAQRALRPQRAFSPLGIYCRLCASSASPKGSGTLYMPKGLSVPKGLSEKEADDRASLSESRRALGAGRERKEGNCFQTVMSKGAPKGGEQLIAKGDVIRSSLFGPRRVTDCALLLLQLLPRAQKAPLGIYCYICPTL